MSSDSQTAGTIHAQLKRENEAGGTLVNLPCPFCTLPRSQRSDYVRSQPCGINWMAGENLAKDPRIDRFKHVVASARKPKQEAVEAQSWLLLTCLR